MKKRILLTASIFTISCTLFGCSAGGKSAIDIARPVTKSSVKALAQDENHDECSLLVGAIYGEQREFMEWDRDKRSLKYRFDHINLGIDSAKEDIKNEHLAMVSPLLEDIAWHPYSRHAIEGIKSYCGSDFESEKQAEMKIHKRLRETFIPDWIGH